jgi:adenylyltransferase/sulfurtransferase
MSYEEELAKLRQELVRKDEQIHALQTQLDQREAIPGVILDTDLHLHVPGELPTAHPSTTDRTLSNSQIARYSRQLILPEIGVAGQLSISAASVLIVGAGGLGCPAAIYLSAAGVGRLGVVDYDEVELSNLHRQILHSEGRVGVAKSASVAIACARLNSSVRYVPYHLSLSSENALDIVRQYDIVLDATDNVATRYLLNDACVLADKPLVSGSALRFEGQLTVYHHKGGPCYRCLYPKPPPPETVTNCSDGGVLGVIPGIIGSLQALEAIKIAAGMESAFSQKLLLFDGLDGSFRTIRLRARQSQCSVCGDQPSIQRLIDYEQFCGARATDKDQEQHIVSDDHRISVQEYKALVDSGAAHVLVDVRQPVELDICRLPRDALNIPLPDVDKDASVHQLQERIAALSGPAVEGSLPVVVVCRRGNDSQVAVRKLRAKLQDGEHSVSVLDIRGGLRAWAMLIDPQFPIY